LNNRHDEKDIPQGTWKFGVAYNYRHRNVADKQAEASRQNSIPID